jgi:hypothetical protein
MPDNATDAICLWIGNDPTRRGEAIAQARDEGLDYLRDYLIGEIEESQEPTPDGDVSEHDGGPYGIRQGYSPTQILNADWEEIRDTLCPLPEFEDYPNLRTVAANAVGDWVNPFSPDSPAGLWVRGVYRAYRDARDTILWSKDPQGELGGWEPSMPGIPECWEIWTELQLWRFDADIAYGGLAFNQEEDWDHQTQTYKQSALTPERIEMRTKENIGDLAGRVLLEIQGTIMSQLLQADLKAWDEQ